MTQITASLVKELRDKTGAGMMDCKKALTECNANVEEALDWLRKKGLSAASKKAGRAAAEGLVGIKVWGTTGALVEVNSETDFVARNEDFQSFVGNLLTISENASDLESLKACEYTSEIGNVADGVTHMVATIGENIQLRRFEKLSVDQGVVAGYVHNAVVGNMGKIGVLVAIESDSSDKDKLEQLGKSLAMQIAAMSPIAVSQDQIDADTVARERKVIEDQIAQQSPDKPANVIEKMTEGRLRKFFEEVCLLDQASIMDTKAKVRDVVASLAKELGSDVTVKSFVRFTLGEGVEKKEDNFAEEVAAQLAG